MKNGKEAANTWKIVGEKDQLAGLQLRTCIVLEPNYYLLFYNLTTQAALQKKKWHLNSPGQVQRDFAMW